MSLCVGLTGGIGCGKSTVSKLFAEHGTRIIDTDTIAHQLTQPHGVAIPAIAGAFGDDYLTGEGALNRGKMRALIFSDALEKKRLENILHPLIFAQAKNELRQLSTLPYVILVVPLLFNSPNFQQLVQRTLVVDCPEKTQLERVLARGQTNEVEARQIIAQQTPRTEQIKRADDVIHNDFSLDDLAKQVNTLHKIYLAEQNTN
jgi:dephospho-CoA kinase